MGIVHRVLQQDYPKLRLLLEFFGRLNPKWSEKLFVPRSGCTGLKRCSRYQRGTLSFVERVEETSCWGTSRQCAMLLVMSGPSLNCCCLKQRNLAKQQAKTLFWVPSSKNQRHSLKIGKKIHLPLQIAGKCPIWRQTKQNMFLVL